MFEPEYERGDQYEQGLLRELGVLGAEALSRLDRALVRAMNPYPTQLTNDRTAPGITYKVYETTLVFALFQAWLARTYVQWDWRRLAPGETTDLIVHPTGLNEEWAFEAKWWLNSKGTWLLENDVERLRRWVVEHAPASGRRAFVIALWWTDPKRTAADVDAADRWYGAEPATPLLFRAFWKTAHDRSFYFDIAEVRGG